jgi:putative ABC transport system permease protein
MMERWKKRDSEFDEEIQAHVQMLAERFIGQGMDPVEARYAALRQFGGVTQVQDNFRDHRRPFVAAMFGAFAHDVRHAWRQLSKAKSFTLSAGLTLAFGIGASTAVFAVFDNLVLRPLPFPESERLIAFRSLERRGGPSAVARPTNLSYPDYFDFRAQNRVFDQLVSYRDTSFTLLDSSQAAAVQVPGLIAAWDLFAALGVQPVVGRTFTAAEEKAGTNVAVISHSLWQRRFGGDQGISGKTIQLNGVVFQVIGVMPERFQFPMDAPPMDVWVTLAQDAYASDQRGGRMLDAIGRLKSGVSIDQAKTQMDAIAKGLAEQYVDSRNVGETSLQLEQIRLTGASKAPLLILMSAVTLLLLIACANVANLLLARNAERGREFALRTALGAGKAAIIRQMLIEGLAFGVLGSAGGILFAVLALQAVPLVVTQTIPRLQHLTLDARVLLFAVGITMATSILFSAAPALQALASDPATALKAGSRNIARGHDRFRAGLVIAQITLGLILMVGAELLMGTFMHLIQRDPGFRPDHLLTFDVALPESRYSASQRIGFTEQLFEELKAIPSVTSVSSGSPLPLQGHEMRIGFDIEERPVEPQNRPRSDAAIVTHDFFQTLGIPLLRGRDFTSKDTQDTAQVVIVNQAFARQHYGSIENAVGKRIKPGAGRTPAWREIVGVVGDAMQAPMNTTAADPIYYFPYRQLTWSIRTIAVRTNGLLSMQEVESGARNAVAKLDRQAAMHHVRTGKDITALAFAPVQFLATLMGVFAGIALLLAGAGLYGVLSYAVAQRRSEIGVRLAMGAGRIDVVSMVFRQAMRLAVVGLVLGVAGALIAGRLLKAATYGVQPGDPFVIAGACFALLIVAAAAAYFPAVRAASVDPMQALRSE